MSNNQSRDDVNFNEMYVSVKFSVFLSPAESVYFVIYECFWEETVEKSRETFLFFKDLKNDSFPNLKGFIFLKTTHILSVEALNPR